MKRYCVFGVLFLWVSSITPVTLVYSLKIRRGFEASAIFQEEPKVHWLASVVPIIYKRSRHIVVPELQQNIWEDSFVSGAVFNLRCVAPHELWAEVTTGLETQTDHVCGTQKFRAQRTGFDDMVFTVGKNFLFDEHKGQVSIYAIGGVPTKQSVTLEERNGTLVGTRFFSLGFGAELSYSFIKEQKRALTALLQTRFIHFFNRQFFPILPCSSQIKPGNATDLFGIIQYREKKNVFEIGCDPTFFTNQGIIAPTEVVPGPSSVRNSFYADYTRVFKESPVFGRPGAIGTGLSVARSQLFDTKIVSWWINMSILF